MYFCYYNPCVIYKIYDSLWNSINIDPNVFLFTLNNNWIFEIKKLNNMINYSSTIIYKNESFIVIVILVFVYMLTR